MMRKMLRKTAAYASSSCNSSALIIVGCIVGCIDGCKVVAKSVFPPDSRLFIIFATVSFIVYELLGLVEVGKIENGLDPNDAFVTGSMKSVT